VPLAWWRLIMRRPFFSNRERRLWAGCLLWVLLFRAYVPVGYMPASGAPFLVEICPSGLPMSAMHHAHHHAASHADFEHCPYGSAPAMGPVSQPLELAAATRIVSPSVNVLPLSRPTARPERAHQPRGPPTLA
jgi:hypothetical protein